MNKQIFVAVFIIALVTSAYAACAERENKDDILEDVKCGLTSAKDKVSDGVSSFIASDTVQTSYSYVKNKTSDAADVLGDAATKTGSFFSSLWEKSKEKFGEVKESLSNNKSTDGEGIIDARQLNLDIVTNAP